MSKIKRKGREGISPMNRMMEWRQETREKDKRTMSIQWFRKCRYGSVICIPVTSKLELKSKYMYEDIIQSNIPIKVAIKVVEKWSTTIQQKVQKLNSIKKIHCQVKENCLVCTKVRTNCRKEGINHKITCDLCGAI